MSPVVFPPIVRSWFLVVWIELGVNAPRVRLPEMEALPPYPLFGISINCPAIEAWVRLVEMPVKAKSADAVEEPPINKSSVILVGASAPKFRCQKPPY